MERGCHSFSKREPGFAISKTNFLFFVQLNRPKLKAYSFDDVKYVVDTNDKQRFKLQQGEDGSWWIRANQGHSLKTVKVELDLIKEPLPICVHGTYTTNWNSIGN
jgi:2'-phosphotransferase